MVLMGGVASPWADTEALLVDMESIFRGPLAL